MGAKPDLQLLANGDILIPEKDEVGAWRVARVVPDDASYAGWLRAVQDRNRDKGVVERAMSFGLAAAIAVSVFIVVMIFIALLASHVA